MLRKGTIKKKINRTEYLVQDLSSEEILTIRVSSKQSVNYPEFKIGEEVQFICSPYEPHRCRLMTSTDLKMN